MGKSQMAGDDEKNQFGDNFGEHIDVCFHQVLFPLQCSKDSCHNYMIKVTAQSGKGLNTDTLQFHHHQHHVDGLGCVPNHLLL